MTSRFPMPFGSITHSITLPSYEAERVLVAIIAEQDSFEAPHWHNFAVQVDSPDGIVIFGTLTLMECIKKVLDG